jgi:hypothetical protein
VPMYLLHPRYQMLLLQIIFAIQKFLNESITENVTRVSEFNPGRTINIAIMPSSPRKETFARLDILTL